MPSYDEWAEILASFYFDEAHDGAEILFAVDDISLAEASGLSEDDAVSSLTAAVRLSIAGQRWHVTTIKRLVERWRDGGRVGPHPALPFLALTVLAASRMGDYQGFSSQKFYVPLRRTLIPDDTETTAPGTYLDDIQFLWNDLARWANEDNEGSRGCLKIRNPGPQFGRGLAIQHALVKSSDLVQLDAFFRRIGLQPGESIPAPELRRALSAWAAGRQESWAQRLVRVSTDPELEEYCEAILSRAAQRWDGNPRDPRTGRAIGRIRLGLASLRNLQIGIYLQYDERLPETTHISLPSGSRVHLQRRYGWYEPNPLEEVDVAFAMSHGFTLTGGDNQFTFRSEDAYVLGYDDDLGIWISLDKISYGDQFYLLVRQEHLHDILAFLSSESALQPRISESIVNLQSYSWTLISHIRFDTRPKSVPPHNLASQLPVAAGPRMQFVGGLPLATARGTYLRDGEPVLALSSMDVECSPELVTCKTGDITELHPTNDSNNEVPLWAYHLEPGHYEVRQGESRLRLVIVDGIAEAAGPRAGDITTQGKGGIQILGTSSSSPAETRQPITIAAPSSGEIVYVLGINSEQLYQLSLPLWFSSRIGYDLSWNTVDAWPDFIPVWRISITVDGMHQASLMNPLDPVAHGDTPNSTWAELIGRSTLTEGHSGIATTLWEKYRNIAGRQP